MKNYKPDWLFRLRYKIILLFILLGGISIFYRCGSVLYLPVTADAEKAGISLDTLNNGRNLYINNCASCHTLYAPEKFTTAEWKKNVNAMQKRAHINDEQKEQILKYLTLKLKK